MIPPSKEDIEAVRASPLFDSDWYLKEYPEAKLLGMGPAEHYLWFGARLNYNPSQDFDAAGYFEANPDVAGTGLNPLLHYLQAGKDSSNANGAGKRCYINFDEFLQASMTQPLIKAEFTEEDKRCFAMMENIANRLCQKALQARAQPLVSVIMPVFNREGIVADSIRSILRQTYANFELVVIDDGSSDGSVEVAESFRDRRIQIIRLGQNNGQTFARNAGLKAATGEIIAYLDSDNEWDDRYLAAVVGAYDQLPEADALYSGLYIYRQGNADPCAVRYGHFNRSLLENNNYIDTNVFTHRRRLLNALGGFNEKLKRFTDYDLALRASEQGRLFSVPMLLCHYYYDKTDDTTTKNSAIAGDLDKVLGLLKERTRVRLAQLHLRDLQHPVTVVIPNWQSLPDLKDCLGALDSRDWKGMLDIIVVDNGSDRSVVDYLRACADEGRITFIQNDRNYGFTYAVNQGIAGARPGSDILLLNNDSIPLGGAIQSLQRECHRQPHAGITVPRQILPAGTNTVTTHVPYANGRNDCDINISAHHNNIASLPLFHDGGVVELNFAPFFAAYIRRDVIDQIGCLDAEYGRHYRSDRIYSDLMRSILGRKIYYVPEAHFMHKLQVATDHLRDVGQRDQSFELMFRRNQWDDETAQRLGYRRAPWDINRSRFRRARWG